MWQRQLVVYFILLTTGQLYLPASPNHPDFLVADSCGANMRPGNGSTVLASWPYPPTVIWGPICDLGTGRLYLPASPNHPDFLVADSCGGQYAAGEQVDCTFQPALPTHSRLGAYMWPGDRSTVLASQPQPPRPFGCSEEYTSSVGGAGIVQMGCYGVLWWF